MTMQTFTGKEYLQIDIANNFGLDKKNWDFRLDWFKSVESSLESLVKQAENPALFYAGVQAYRKAQQGIASGYPITLDGCSSGLQLLACLIGDKAAAKLCGVIDTGDRADAYTIVYEAMTEYLGESSKISRSEVKQAIMTSLYGSEAQPKKVFGEGELLELFFNAMALLAPGAWELNQAYLALWDPEATKYSWTLPDNFHVHTKVMDTVFENVHFDNAPFTIIRKVNQATKKGRSLGANTTHSLDGYIVREIVRRCNYDREQLIQVKTALCCFSEPSDEMDEEKAKMVNILWGHYKKTGMLSARIFDYIDEDTAQLIEDRSVIFKLIYSMPLAPFQVLTIHDAFRCLPNYGNDIRQQYNNLLAEIAKGDLLNHILECITGREINLKKQDPQMWVEVQHANYALS